LESLRYNWIGKVCAILLGLGIHACLSRGLQEEAGVFVKPRPPEWASVVLVSVLTAGGFSLLSYVESQGAQPLRWEAIFYQATMPGLDEEAYFRGIILALLVGAFGKPLRILGIQVGWGAVPVLAVFGLGHGVYMGESGVSVDWDAFLVTGIMGCLLLWLKERTGSIWVPVLVHNLSNLGAHLAR
jgi:membrane protease YdiL (CAAX protease family)